MPCSLLRIENIQTTFKVKRLRNYKIAIEVLLYFLLKLMPEFWILSYRLWGQFVKSSFSVNLRIFVLNDK